MWEWDFSCPLVQVKVSTGIKKLSAVGMGQVVHSEGTVDTQGRIAAHASKDFLLLTSRVSKYALVLGTV